MALERIERALVTGATGFVGGNVALALHRAGARVRALARPGSGTLALEGVPVELAPGALEDRESLREAMEGCDAVFHVAALNAFWARDPGAFHRTNVEGTRNVMSAALEAGVARVVHTSTWAVLGRGRPGAPATEETAPARADLSGPYRRTKYLAEQEALGFLRRGLDVVVVSPTVVVGRGDVKPTPSGRIVLDFMRGSMPAYVNAHLNLVDVEDVAQGHLLACLRGRPGERYILGNRNMTLGEVLEALEGVTGRRRPRLRLPVGAVLAAAYLDRWVEGAVLRREPRIPLEGVRHAMGYRAVDCSRAVGVLGLPQTPVEEALRKAVDWFRTHGYV